MVKNTQTSQGWSSENGSSLKEPVKISSTQNESDLWAETKGRLVPPWPSVDGEGLKWWMQKLERQVWTEGRSKVWLCEVAEHPGAGSTSYAPHIAFLHLLQVHGPRPADWAKPTSGRIQSARSSLSLSFWPGHRSTCVYQLRTNIQLSTVRKSCHCWPNGPLSCGVEPLE